MAFGMRWKVRTLWALVLVLMVSPVNAQEKAKAAPKPKQDEYFELMQTFVDTFEQVDRNYVKDVDRRKLLEAALRGMIKELDPYSSYIPPEELAPVQPAGGPAIRRHRHSSSARPEDSSYSGHLTAA